MVSNINQFKYMSTISYQILKYLMQQANLHQDQDTCSVSSEIPEGRQQGIQSRTPLPLIASPSCSRGYSSFRGIMAPRTLLLRTSLPIDYLFLFVPSKMVVETNLIDFHQHSMSLLHPDLSYISNIAIISTSVQTVTEDSRNYSRNHKYNPGRYKGIARCRSCKY